MTESRNRRLPASRPARLAFWLVAVATLVNFNHLANMTVGTGWFITIGLTLCCVFLCLIVRIPLRQALGIPGFLIVATLISYLLIGLSVAFVNGDAWYATDRGRIPFYVGLAVLVIVATALGASEVLRRVGVERLLKGIAAILAVTCILILATPLLVDYLYVFPSRLSSLLYQASSRFMGTFTTPTMASTVGCYAVVTILSLSSSGRNKKFAGLALILACAAVIMTFSRTGIITLALIFLFFLKIWVSNLLLKRTSSVGLAIVPVAGVVVLTIVNLEYLPVKADQLTHLMWFVNYEDSSLGMNDRFALWPLALSEIAESPLLGHGITRFHQIGGALICQLELPCGSHNAYLMLWGEAGIIPLTLFLTFIGLLLQTSMTLPKSIATNTITGWTLVFATACMARDGVPYFVWSAFILGLSCALAAHVQREARGRRSGRTLETRPASARTAPPDSAPSITG